MIGFADSRPQILFPQSVKESKRGRRIWKKKCSGKQGSINSPDLAFLDPSWEARLSSVMYHGSYLKHLVESTVRTHSHEESSISCWFSLVWADNPATEVLGEVAEMCGV